MNPTGVEASQTNEPPQPAPDAPAALAVHAAVAAGVRRILGSMSDAAAGKVEGVHQMRVGTRRLRSDLRTFHRLVDRNWSEPLRDELRWLGGVLGGVRDLDVLIGRLREDAAEDVGRLGPLFDVLGERHVRARAALLDALDSTRFGDLEGRLIDASSRPRMHDRAGAASAEVLPPLVRRAWKDLADAGRAIEPDSDEDELHAVRILAKRARYAAEAIAPALGPERGEQAEKFAKAAADVQDLLGTHRDAVLAAAEIERIAAADPDDPPFHEAAARLARLQREHAGDSRQEFSAVWKQLDRPRRRRWMDR